MADVPIIVSIAIQRARNDDAPLTQPMTRQCGGASREKLSHTTRNRFWAARINCDRQWIHTHPDTYVGRLSRPLAVSSVLCRFQIEFNVYTTYYICIGRYSKRDHWESVQYSGIWFQFISLRFEAQHSIRELFCFAALSPGGRGWSGRRSWKGWRVLMWKTVANWFVIDVSMHVCARVFEVSMELLLQTENQNSLLLIILRFYWLFRRKDQLKIA